VNFGQPGEASMSLNELSGLPCEQAIAAITQALTSDAGDADKIRGAMNAALVEALYGVAIFDPSCITDDVLVNIMINYISESVFLQIIMDGAKAWNKADTTPQFQRAELDLREIVKVVVDKNMAAKLEGKVRTFTKTEIVQIERQVIIEVWREWESYQ
jgi:hypothetical protein